MLSRIFPVIMCAVVATPAFAGWEYPGDYVGAGWYEDDGARFVFSARGGAAYGMATVENKLGSIIMPYVQDGDAVYPCSTKDCEGYIGYGEWGNLPVGKDYSGFSFAAGASIGFTVPYRPQWRIEASWDHIAETDYNVSPLFEGELPIIGSDVAVYQDIGSLQSTVTTDIVSAMMFYDFYEGLQKPLGTFIPYVGFGVGYARAKTTTTLTDETAALSLVYDFHNYGETDDNGYITFYPSDTETGNFAALLSVGVSYGITESVFLDLGARAIYVPQIKWSLTNADDTRHRELLSGNNAFFGTVTLGIRFEF